jgi:hypothetical protein
MYSVVKTAMEDGIEQGIEQGIEEGIKLGVEQEKLEQQQLRQKNSQSWLKR